MPSPSPMPPRLPLDQRWRRHTRGVAAPTLLLTAAVVAGEAAVWWAVCAGHMALWLGAALTTVLAYASFTPLHEASHGNVRGTSDRGPWLDTIVGWIAAVPLLAPFPAFRALHLAHHSHTNHADADPDHWVAGDSAWSVALRCATIAPYYYWHFLAGPLSRTRSGQRPRNASIAGMVGIAAVTTAAVVAGLGLELVALWIVPGLLASAVLAFLFDYLPHQPHDSRVRFQDTRVFPSRLLTVPMAGQNYHLVHHLYPRIPFYRYGACFWDVRDLLVENGSPVGQPRDRRERAHSLT